MIEHGRGNLLEAQVAALVNTVNTEGVMGKGIALQFKQAFPDNFKAYAKACAHKEVSVGKMFVFDRGVHSPRWIINFPTKKRWRLPSCFDYVDAGLVDLIRTVRKLGILSIAVPPLGCGNGGLSWEEVRPRIVAAFAEASEIRVLLYDPPTTTTTTTTQLSLPLSD